MLKYILTLCTESNRNSDFPLLNFSDLSSCLEVKRQLVMGYSRADSYCESEPVE